MSNFMPILEALEEFPLDVHNRVLIVELSDKRMAWAILRKSSIWKFAIILSRSYLQWRQDWQNLTANLSEKQINNLLEYCETPDGPDLAQVFDALTKQIETTGITHVIPVGEFSKLQCWSEALSKRFTGSGLISPIPQAHLPVNTDKQQLREEIEKFYPPVVPEDYFLESFEIQGKQLTKCSRPLLTKGQKPPIVANFKDVKLYRPIHLNGSNTQSKIHIVLRNSQNGFITGLSADQPSGQNRFKLRCWFNYDDDGLRIKVLDASGQKDVSSERIGKQDEKALPGLPPIKQVSYADIVWIVDGTIRSKIGPSDWRPDIESARDFIKAITAQLMQGKDTDIHCALALYGDWKHSTAKYFLREHSLRDINAFHNLIRSGTDIDATDDLDYEAALELALQWINQKVVWRPQSKRYVIVIGYAPPHFPAKGDKISVDKDILVWQDKFGFTHEPFTTKIDYEKELDALKKSGVINIAVWVPYPELEPAAVLCMKYSRYIWSKIGDDGKYFYERLETDTRENVLKTILDHMAQNKLWISADSIKWPLLEQLHNLRCQ